MESKIEDKYLLFPIILLAGILLYRLIKFSQILHYFPFNIGDLAQRMAQFFLFAKYGFLNLVPTWYNGFISLKFYPPLWYFFTYPFYVSTNNLNQAILLSLIFMLLIALLFMLYFGKLVRLSFAKRIALFFLFFSSPLLIDQIFNIGKLPELFGWMLFIPLFFLFVYYKDNKLDLKFFIWFIILYSGILLSHPFLWPGVSFFLLSLLFVKIFKEKIHIIFSIILSLFAVSFWLIPFLLGLQGEAGCNFICLDIRDYIEKPEFSPHHINPLRELLFPGSIFSFSTFISIGFLIMFFVYWKSVDKSKKELLFYSPFIFLSIAILTRIIIFLPFLNKPPINPYNTLLLFPLLFLFLKTRYPIYYKKIPSILAILIPIIFLLSNFYLIDDKSLSYSAIDKEFMEISKDLDSRYLPIMDFTIKNQYIRSPSISYITIKKDLSTPYGAFNTDLSKELFNKLNSITNDFKNNDCKNAVSKINELEVDQLLSYKEHCSFIEKCKLKAKTITENYCIYEVN